LDLDFNEQQEMLRKSARDFLSKECPIDLVRELERDATGFSPGLWRKVAGLGWLGIPFPERYGGSEGSFIDVAPVMEELGRAVFPGPYLSSVVLAGLAILDAGSEEQKAELLPAIARGERIAAFALTEPSARFDAQGVQMRAVRRVGGYALEGVKLFVRDAQIADELLVAARTRTSSAQEQGVTLFLVEAKAPGVTITQLRGIGTDRMAEVAFADLRAPASRVVGELHGGWPVVARALERGTVALCAQMVGGAQRALEMTVEYAKQRVQFGVPIGSFQAVQHRCADMLTDVDTSRLMTYYAAWKLSEGLPCALEISMAKAWLSNAYKRVVRSAHQVHGGAAYIQDHNLQFYFRNAKASELYLGDSVYHRGVVQRCLGY